MNYSGKSDILYGENQKERTGTMKQKKTVSNCESCMNYEYDEEYEYYVCTKNLDEDEMYRFVKGEFRDCPYYQFGDEYRIVRKQMWKNCDWGRSQIEKDYVPN